MWRLMAACIVASGCGRIAFDDTWWNRDWGFREQLTIDHAQVAGDLADFPVLVPLTDPALVANAAAELTDVAFTDLIGRPLAFELDHGNAWVRLPSLRAAADTHFFVYFGNPAAVSQAMPAAVWTNNYIDVVHFGTAGTLEVDESTSTNTANASANETPALGQIGGAVHFAGVQNSGVAVSTDGVDTAAGGLNTVSFWMNYTGPTGGMPFAFDNGGPQYDLWYQRVGCFGFNTRGSEALGAARSDLSQRWVHIAAVFYNGLPNPAMNALYIDGAAQALTRCFVGGGAISRTAELAAIIGGDGSYEMTGDIDEVHVAIGARDGTWIATEFANQSAPETFVVAGPLERR